MTFRKKFFPLFVKRCYTKDMFDIIEIFDSLEGEGIRQGLAATFIRFAGCNLRCSWCDTVYSQTNANSKNMSEVDIVKKVNGVLKRITLTGGEPLIQGSIINLIKSLLATNSGVVIETNGSIDISPYLNFKNLFFSIDYKLSDSGVNDKMLESNFLSLRPNDAIKFVVASIDDLEEASDFIKKLAVYYKSKKVKMPYIYMTATDKNLGREMLDKILKNPHLSNVRVYTQLHKELKIK